MGFCLVFFFFLEVGEGEREMETETREGLQGEESNFHQQGKSLGSQPIELIRFLIGFCPVWLSILLFSVCYCFWVSNGFSSVVEFRYILGIIIL